MTPGKRDKWEGRVEATLESIKEDQKEMKVALKENMVEIKKIFGSHLDNSNNKNNEFDKRIDKMGNRVTAVEIKSGIFGTIGGVIGGFISGFLK